MPKVSSRPPKERQQVKNYPTPKTDDSIIFEYRNADYTRNQSPVYGTTTPAHGNWPNHLLAHIAPADELGMQKWTFVANRESQDDYNWEQNGESVIRTYVVPRNKYFGRADADAVVVDEFTYPPVTTADALFPAYGFVDDTVTRFQDPVLDSLYVNIRRRFIEPVTTEIRYNDQFKKSVKITKEIVAHTEPVTSPTPVAAGGQVEIQHGNQYHNVKITQLLVDSNGTTTTYPYQLEDIPSTRNFAFPSKLDSVDLVFAWAVANAVGHRESFSEDYYFEFKITDPRPGPYKAVVERWITDDPAAIQTANPRTDIPQPVRESIGIVNWWFYSSAEAGNATSASAKEWSVPSTIHEEVTVSPTGTTTSAPSTRHQTTTLAQTPGVTAFLGLDEAVIHYEAKEMGLGLYEVSVVKVDITDLYG